MKIYLKRILILFVHILYICHCHDINSQPEIVPDPESDFTFSEPILYTEHSFPEFAPFPNHPLPDSGLESSFLAPDLALPADPRRPLPKQENDLVHNLIKELLDSNVDPAQIKLDMIKTGVDSPLKLINSTEFWSLDDLKPRNSIKNKRKAKKWVETYLSESQIIFSTAAKAGWNYFTNITELNHKSLAESEQVLGEFLTVVSKKAQQFDQRSFKNNATLKRIIQMLAIEGMTALPSEEFEMFSGAQKTLSHIFGNGAVCEKGRPPPCTLRYPELQHLMGTNHQPSNLLYIWLAWRSAMAKSMKPVYLDLIYLSNEGARLNGYPDAGALWRSPYEETSPDAPETKTIDLEEELMRLWDQIKPLYAQLHAFVRRQMVTLFPAGTANELTQDGPIPAHLLGTLNTDTWISMFGETVPFAIDHSSVGTWMAGNGDQITPELVRRNFTVLQMFKEVEKLYISMGFPPLSEKAWNESILTRPWTTDMLCDPPAAFDFRDGKNYRIKSCSRVSYPDFIEAHRLLGNVYYQMQYKHLPLPFREGANPSFPQAVADAFGLHARSPAYLQALKLARKSEPIDASSPDPEKINKLYQEALEQVAHLPFSLVVDVWRWQLLDGRLTDENMNDGWWELRKKYQGIKPPVERTAEDLDPVSSPLVSQQHYPSTRRFISYILQFQILKALCNQAAGQELDTPFNPDQCNLLNSKDAGTRLKSLMKLGASKPWPEALEMISGSMKLDASALMDYYKPLYSWLKTENERTKTDIGWDGPGTPFPIGRGQVDDLYPEQSIDTGFGGGIQDHQFHGGNLLEVTKNMPPRDKVSFPGEDCSGGQVCLQQSVCEAGLCTCPGDNVQWHGHCLPNDPTLVGFGRADSNGFKLDIIEEEALPEPENDTTKPKTGKEDMKLNSAASQFTISYVVILFTVAVFSITGVVY